MAGASNVNDVEIVLLDEPVEMHVDEIQPWCCVLMAEQAPLHVLNLQRLTQQRIVHQINLGDREIICRPPTGVHFAQFFRRQRVS